MGNWTITIEGHGVHDNGVEHDAEARLAEFVGQLLKDGHQVHHATITVGGVRELVPGSSEQPAHYVYQP